MSTPDIHTGYDTEVLSVGLCYATCCTNASDALARFHLNTEVPSGVGPWNVSRDETFSSGRPNPYPCPEKEGFRHVLFDC